jgi:hypothetical protein
MNKRTDLQWVGALRSKSTPLVPVSHDTVLDPDLRYDYLSRLQAEILEILVYKSTISTIL